LEFVVENIVADILPTSEGAKFAHTLHVCEFLMRELRASSVHFKQDALTLPFADI